MRSKEIASTLPCQQCDCGLQETAAAEKIEAYAAQSVAEFKERLKEAIRRDLPVSLVNKDKFLTLIDETK